MKCGEAFRRSELEREYQPPSPAMIRGTVLHGVAAISHDRQMKGKVARSADPRTMVLRESLPSEEEAADMAATRFDLERSSSGVAIQADATDSPAKVMGHAKDSSVKMARHYVGRVAPYIDPIAVEHKIVVEPSDMDIRISGIIDLVTNEGGGKRSVRDIKTGVKSPAANLAHESGQLSMYALLDRLENGSIAHSFALDYIVQDDKAFTAPYRVSLETTRTQEDLDVMVARLNNAIEGVKAGVFLANGVGQWWCSPRWCKFHSTCRFVSKAAR